LHNNKIAIVLCSANLLMFCLTVSGSFKGLPEWWTFCWRNFKWKQRLIDRTWIYKSEIIFRLSFTRGWGRIHVCCWNDHTEDFSNNKNVNR